MNRSLFFLFLMAFCALHGSELSLRQCLELARENNPTLEIAHLRTRQALEGKNMVRAALLPQISLEGVWDNRNDTLSGELTQFQDYNATKALGVSVKQSLFDFGASWMRLRAGRQRIEAAKLSAEGACLNVEEQVKNAYYQILLQEEVVQVIRGTVATLEKQVSQSKALEKEGIVKHSDVLAASVQLSEKQTRLLQEENTLKRHRMTLNRLIGLPLFETPLLKKECPVQENSFSFSVDFDRALSHRKEYLALTKQIEALQNDARAANMSLLPRFYAFGNGNYSAQKSAVSAGIGMSLPLFQGGAQRAESNKLSAEVRALKAQLRDMEQQMAIEIESAHLQLQEIEKSVEMARQSIVSAQEALANYQALYSEGQMTITELLLAQDTLTHVTLGYATHLYRYWMTLAHLNTLTGGSDV